MVVLSAKFTILISINEIGKPQYCIAAWRLDMHIERTHISVKGSEKRSFILVSDKTLVWNFNHVNEELKSKSKFKSEMGL